MIAADVSVRAEMERAFAETLRLHGAIHGVIHAAGIIRDGLIETKTSEDAMAVIAPKLHGCEIVHSLATKAGTELLVLFSSTASVLGPAGQIDYAAANACLDAFSHSVAHRGGPRTLTINWPGWRETGILAEMEVPPAMQQWKEDALAKAISTADGLEAFQRALASELPQIIVSPQDLNALLRETAPPPSGIAAGTAPTLDAAELSFVPEDALERTIAETWASVLGFAKFGRDENFFALGGHSLLAMQVVARLRTHLGTGITLRDFFEAPTIMQLGTFVREQMIQDIGNLSDEEVRALIAKEAQSHG